MTSPNIRWREVSPGKWVRDFAPVEDCMNFATYLVPDQPQLCISMGGTMPEKKTVEDIKNAWVALRHSHPMIACKITSTGYEYQVPTEDEVRQWVEETVYVDYSGRTGEELLISAVPSNSAAGELYFMPDTSEICILMRHEAIDGVGSMMLLNQLLKAVRQGTKVAKFGDEPARLTRSIDQIMKKEKPSKSLIQRAFQMKEAYTKKRSLSLKTKPADTSAPGPSRKLECIFGETETSVILKACKERGITITNATTAAVVKAVLEVSGEESGNYCGFCPVNLRDSLPPPYNGQEGCVGNLLSGFWPVMPVTKSSQFLKLAKHHRKLCDDWRYKTDSVGCTVALPKLLKTALTEAAIDRTEVPTTVSLVGLGIIDKHVTEPVENFWFNLGLSVSLVVVYVYTVKGRLRYTIFFNEGFHEPSDIKELLDIIRLRSNAGLDLESALVGGADGVIARTVPADLLPTAP
ncbi:hypothetical protein TWF718_003418 [Orbilia javanica]|uniref:Uncharacterized protein n=1 Tax=Orbilia javanica TaxID=47235 RepID=A0AAN8MGH6_9PEZI